MIDIMINMLILIWFVDVEANISSLLFHVPCVIFFVLQRPISDELKPHSELPRNPTKALSSCKVTMMYGYVAMDQYL